MKIHNSFQKVVFLIFLLTGLTWTSCNKDDDGNLGLDYVAVYNLSTAGDVFLEGVSIIDENGTVIDLGGTRDINEILNLPSGRTMRLTAKGVIYEGLIDATIRATPPGSTPISVMDAAFNGGELDSLPFNFDLQLTLP